MDKTRRHANETTSTARAKAALLVFFAALIAVSAVPFVAEQGFEPMQAMAVAMPPARDDPASVLQSAVRDATVAWAAQTASARQGVSPSAKF